jgi:hypothetical protein
MIGDLRNDNKRVRRRTHENNIRAELNHIAKNQRLCSTQFAKNCIGKWRGKNEASGVTDEDKRHDGVGDVVVLFHVWDESSDDCNASEWHQDIHRARPT